MTKLASEWWEDISPKTGFKFMDRHSDGSFDVGFNATGKNDFVRARRKTGIPDGKHLSILEIGCGLGRMTEAMAPYYGCITAVDISEQFIQWAREHSGSNNIRYCALDANNLTILSRGSYDLVISYEVFHYLNFITLDRYFKEVVQQSETIFVFQMNTVPFSLLTKISRQIRKLLFANGVFQWRNWPTDPRFFHYAHDIEAVTKLLHDVGFSYVRVIDPLSKDTWFIATNSDSYPRE